MKNEFLYSKPVIKANKEERNSKVIACRKVQHIKEESLKLTVQEIYIFNAVDTNQDLEKKLQEISNYELSFIR